MRDFGLYPKNKSIEGFTDNELFDGIKDFQKIAGVKVDGVMRPKGETESRVNQVMDNMKLPPKPKTKPNKAVSSLRAEKAKFENRLQDLQSQKSYILSQISAGETKTADMDNQYRKDATRYGASLSPDFFSSRGGVKILGKAIEGFLNDSAPTGSEVEKQMVDIKNMNSLIRKHRSVLLDMEKKIKDTQVKIRMIEREMNVVER